MENTAPTLVFEVASSRALYNCFVRLSGALCSNLKNASCYWHNQEREPFIIAHKRQKTIEAVAIRFY